MIEQFNFDIRLIFAILNGKVSAAINRKLSRNFPPERFGDYSGTVDRPHLLMGKGRGDATRVV